MKKKILQVLFIILLTVIFTKELNAGGIFSRDLKLGDKGGDVQSLQIFLNNNPQTRLAESGPGSPNEETTYFGPLTRSAVVAFQNLYKNQILEPVGLNYGTGYWGKSSKLWYQSLIDPTSNTENETEDEIILGPNNQFIKDLRLINDDITINDQSVFQGPGGTTVELSGWGFETDSKILFGNDRIIETRLKDSNTLEFKIPNDLGSGQYNITVKNKLDMSVAPSTFFITDENSAVPIVKSTNPERGSYGTDIIITGSNFTATNNIVQSKFGSINNISSTDGKTLRFKYEPLGSSNYTKELKEAVNIMGNKIELYVINENGFTPSNKAGTFYLDI